MDNKHAVMYIGQRITEYALRTISAILKMPTALET